LGTYLSTKRRGTEQRVDDRAVGVCSDLDDGATGVSVAGILTYLVSGAEMSVGEGSPGILARGGVDVGLCKVHEKLRIFSTGFQQAHSSNLQVFSGGRNVFVLVEDQRHCARINGDGFAELAQRVIGIGMRCIRVAVLRIDNKLRASDELCTLLECTSLVSANNNLCAR